MSQVSQQRLDAQFDWGDTAGVQQGLRLLMKVVEARLSELEGQRADYAGVIEELTQVALVRINEVLLPALPLVDELIRTGFGSDRIIDAGSFGRDILKTKTEAEFFGATHAARKADLDQTVATVASLLQRLDTIQGGANTALDTFAEIAARFGQEDSATAAVLDAVAKRLRFDAAQTLTAPQRGQALTNLGASALAQQLVQAATQEAMRTVMNAQQGLGFWPVQQGGGPGQAANRVRVGWDGAAMRMAVDEVDLGRIWADHNNPITYGANQFWQQRLGSGWIMMGGNADSPSEDFRLIFPNAFPNECRFIAVTNTFNVDPNQAIMACPSAIDRFGVDVRRRAILAGGGVTAAGGPCQWQAMGR